LKVFILLGVSFMYIKVSSKLYNRQIEMCSILKRNVH